MAQPQTGNTVVVHYTGRLEDGTVFDSSREGEPLRFTLGTGQVLPGFERAVLGLEAGQSRTVTLSPEEGYGQHRDDLVVEMERRYLPSEVQVGHHVHLPMGGDNQLPVIVTAVSEATVTFDANHPLAGEELIFDIELIEVE